MNTIVPFLENATKPRPRAAILLSGSGSNAEKIIQHKQAVGESAPFEIAVLFTDAPERSRARQLAETYDLPLVENDIRQFYRERGQKRMTIATPEGQQIREEWTRKVRVQLKKHDVDFCIMAGFVPLTNLTADLPSLNVHPGDLTYLKDGKRYLTGLHTIPIERAILEGLESLRSSVIIAQPYTGHGSEMDSGPILGISPPVEIDFQGRTLQELKTCVVQRPSKRPRGGYGDILEEVAAHNQTRLKENSDWVVFPRVVVDFAAQRFGQDQDGGLMFYTGSVCVPIQTVVYSQNERELLLRNG